MKDELPKPVSATASRMSSEVALRLSIGGLVGICVGALLRGICCSPIVILSIKGSDLSAGLVWGFKQDLILPFLPGGNPEVTTMAKTRVRERA